MFLFYLVFTCQGSMNKYECQLSISYISLEPKRGLSSCGPVLFGVLQICVQDKVDRFTSDMYYLSSMQIDPMHSQLIEKHLLLMVSVFL